MTYYFYGFKGDRFFGMLIRSADELGGVVAMRRRKGWRVFYRRIAK